jgi:spermidine synthase
LALLWKKQTADTLYEIRTAGRTLRLYTNGVFHTQYNPSQPLTGHVWDLLMLPAFFYQPEEIKRILVLGVGGGAVMNMLKQFIQPEEMIGIELDAVHIALARRFFNIKGKGIKLYRSDAVTWLQQYQGEKFDLIIDDLFGEREGEPFRAVAANNKWFTMMLKNLTADGVIVGNFVGLDDLKQSAGLNNHKVNRRFKSIFQLSSQYDENYVGAFIRKKVTASQLRSQVIQVPGLNPALKTSRLKYKIKKLK